MDFPQSNFEFDVLTTHNFFEKNYRLLKVKIHLDRSHITGKICGYVHGFCDWKLREHRLNLSFLAHNMLGFYFILFLS